MVLPAAFSRHRREIAEALREVEPCRHFRAAAPPYRFAMHRRQLPVTLTQVNRRGRCGER